MLMKIAIPGPVKIIEYRRDPSSSGPMRWEKAVEGHDLLRNNLISISQFNVIREFDRKFTANDADAYASSRGAIICTCEYQLDGVVVSREQAYLNAKRIADAYNIYGQLKFIAEGIIPLIEKNLDYPYPIDRELTKAEQNRALFIVGIAAGLKDHLKKWFNISTTEESKSDD
jgi:hypothetical protein